MFVSGREENGVRQSGGVPCGVSQREDAAKNASGEWQGADVWQAMVSGVEDGEAGADEDEARREGSIGPRGEMRRRSG